MRIPFEELIAPGEKFAKDSLMIRALMKALLSRIDEISQELALLKKSVK
ncbi:hypothetical protein GCM10027299_32820 [Larkinella ripae]